MSKPGLPRPNTGTKRDHHMNATSNCSHPLSRHVMKSGLSVRMVFKNGAKSKHFVKVTLRNAEFINGNWSRLGDLNPGPTHYECVALPLS